MAGATRAIWWLAAEGGSLSELAQARTSSPKSAMIKNAIGPESSVGLCPFRMGNSDGLRAADNSRKFDRTDLKLNEICCDQPDCTQDDLALALPTLTARLGLLPLKIAVASLAAARTAAPKRFG